MAGEGSTFKFGRNKVPSPKIIKSKDGPKAVSDPKQLHLSTHYAYGGGGGTIEV